jgi:phytoene dehydrogenase-like protein
MTTSGPGDLPARADAVVVGAGFGGLACALGLSELGARVVLLESRGTGHVRGGIGRLAVGLVEAIRRLGGSVSMPNAVKSLERTRRGWRVATRRGAVEAPLVVANLLPQTLRKLAGTDLSSFASGISRRIEEGFGAAMLYRVVRAPGSAGEAPTHLALVADPSAPLVEGNHVFCSFSGGAEADRAPAGYRTATISTHVRASGVDDPGAYLHGIHERMRATLRALAPEWGEDVAYERSASPRTFERFTGRYRGLVGGIPRRVGLHNYRHLEPRPALDGLWLVGDAIFPGQGTLGAALGGWKLAQHLAA